jgi:hypothetical protein
MGEPVTGGEKQGKKRRGINRIFPTKKTAIQDEGVGQGIGVYSFDFDIS